MTNDKDTIALKDSASADNAKPNSATAPEKDKAAPAESGGKQADASVAKKS